MYVASDLVETRLQEIFLAQERLRGILILGAWILAWRHFFYITSKYAAHDVLLVQIYIASPRIDVHF